MLLAKELLDALAAYGQCIDRLRQEGVSEWEVVERALISTEGGAKLFAAIQAGGEDLTGFIIASWEGDHVRYMHECETPGDIAWCGFSHRLGTETEAESPKMYRTLNAALSCIRKLRKSEWCPSCGLLLWSHPEVSVTPFSKYVRMSESRHVPGHPQQ